MFVLTGKIVKCEYREFEGKNGRPGKQVFFGTIGDADNFQAYEVSGEAQPGLKVGDTCSMQVEKLESSRWGIKLRGRVSLGKA